MRNSIGEHAVVIGAGMGGLTAAAALSDFFAKVIILERDDLPPELGALVAAHHTGNKTLSARNRLAGVVLAIQRADAIRASVSDLNPPVVTIQPAHQTFLPTFALMFLGVYLAGALGWAVLFALRRSGVHRLSRMSSAPER